MASRPTSPRIAPLPAAERTPSAQAVLDTVTTAGSEANIFTTLIRAEGLTRRWLPFGGKLLNGKIPARDRELLILRTGWDMPLGIRRGQACGHRSGRRAVGRGDSPYPGRTGRRRLEPVRLDPAAGRRR